MKLTPEDYRATYNAAPIIHDNVSYDNVNRDAAYWSTYGATYGATYGSTYGSIAKEHRT